MLSVLIPTYNYNVYPLVKEIHKQISKLAIEFEILVYDDASTIDFENIELIKELNNVVYKKLPDNLGRTAIRHLLTTDAKFENLLFLDADTFPKDRYYIAKFIKTIEKYPADVYFGGIQVPTNPPSPDKMLRWKYGKERESLPVEKRKEKPYRSILCGAVLIKKSVFLPIITELKAIKKYGLDLYFSYQLKKQQAEIHHFHNPIIHLGLETSEDFLKKTEQAIDTLKFLIKNRMIAPDYSRLSEKAQQLSTPGCKTLTFPCIIFKKLCIKNLLSANPSLFIFDLYKLFYFCHQTRK